MTEFNFLSLNVRGLSQLKKRKAVLTWCKKQKADVIFLQETHSTKETENDWKRDWGNSSVYFSHGKSNARGACILFKKPSDFDVLKQVTDNSGRVVILKVRVNDTFFSLINVYGPNDRRLSAAFFDNLATTLSNEDISNGDNIIMGGDFNVCQNPVLDRHGDTNTYVYPKLMECFQNLKSNLEIVDIWRTRNPTIRSYTWAHKSKPRFSRIDFWLISSHLQDVIDNADIIPSIKSDHSAISLKLKKISKERGPGFWKFNASLLQDYDYKLMMENLLKSLLKEKGSFNDTLSFWEWVKYNIRKESIIFSKQKAKQKRQQEDYLQSLINTCKENYELDPSLKKRNELMTQTSKLEELYDRKVEGMLTRSKLKWYEQGEKSTKYFFNLEKRNYEKKHIRRLLVKEKIVTDPKAILMAQFDFYKQLYERDKHNISEETVGSFLSDLDIPCISELLKETCEGKITIKECDEIIKTFQNGKSPGNDGITCEFYKEFWTFLRPVLVECFNDSFQLDR